MVEQGSLSMEIVKFVAVNQNVKTHLIPTDYEKSHVPIIDGNDHVHVVMQLKTGQVQEGGQDILGEEPCRSLFAEGSESLKAWIRFMRHSTRQLKAKPCLPRRTHSREYQRPMMTS